jgi:hypothetical protein
VTPSIPTASGSVAHGAGTGPLGTRLVAILDRLPRRETADSMAQNDLFPHTVID